LVPASFLFYIASRIKYPDRSRRVGDHFVVQVLKEPSGLFSRAERGYTPVSPERLIGPKLNHSRNFFDGR
jgi:hypothetical protein